MVQQVGPETSRLGRRALVVTGKKSSKSSGALDAVVCSLKKAGVAVEVFDQVEENPSVETVECGGEVARNGGCEVVVALGGGSPMDAAKGMAILAVLDGRVEDYFGSGKVTAPVLPVVALPTTAGTGSEVTPYAVFVDSEAGLKKSVASGYIFPQVALLDPRLTTGMPPEITANTGIDALSHALEGFTSAQAQPISDALALEAIKLLNDHLPRAVSHGDDLRARSEVLYASMLAGMVIAQTGTTLLHGMGYALTTTYGIPHGLANGVLMPQVTAFNGKDDPERYARLALVLGQRSDPASGTDLAVEALIRLRHEVGMPVRLKALGVREEDLVQFAGQTLGHTRNLANNIRQASLDDIIQIYRESY
jgi:1,3-propanediol dehydrogenase/alcohol dehydrogenase